jgi:pimeloyl-ACP methyl ester carboxylesterase
MDHRIRLNGKAFFYRSFGEGPVLLLLHGFGEDGSVWSDQFEAFPGYRLLVPDLPGSGGSEKTDDMSMEGMAATVNNLLDHLGIHTCILIGHSMGGYISLAFGEKYGEKLSGFGLFHSTAYPDSEEKKAIRKKGMEFIEKNGGYEFLKTATPSLYSAVTKEQNPGIVEQQIEGSRNFSGSSLVTYYKSMMDRPDRTDMLTKTKLPVLFILGKWDTAVPVMEGLKLCTLPELSYIHVLQNSGHMGMREEPKLSNRFISEYLQNLRHSAR